MKITESLPSRLEIIPDFISSTIEKIYFLPLDEDVIFSVKLCLHEAVINAVKHGNKLNSDLTVEIDINIDENWLTIEVTDQGEGFNFKRLPDPTKPENVLKLEGRGIFLINNLMNKVQFSNGGRTIKMMKKVKKGRRGRMDIKTEVIDGINVVILEGEINVSNAMELKKAFGEILDTGAAKILVDFEQVSFIDSSGLAVLIELVNRLQEVKGKLNLCNVNRKIKGIFEITKIHKMMDIFESRETALSSF